MLLYLSINSTTNWIEMSSKEVGRKVMLTRKCDFPSWWYCSCWEFNLIPNFFFFPSALPNFTFLKPESPENFQITHSALYTFGLYPINIPSATTWRQYLTHHFLLLLLQWRLKSVNSLSPLSILLPLNRRPSCFILCFIVAVISIMSHTGGVIFQCFTSIVFAL